MIAHVMRFSIWGSYITVEYIASYQPLACALSSGQLPIQHHPRSPWIYQTIIAIQLTYVTTTTSITVHHMQPYNPIPTPRFSVPASVNSVNEMMESSLMPPSIRYCPGFHYPTSTTSTYREAQQQDEHLIPKTQQACHHELPSRPGTAI